MKKAKKQSKIETLRSLFRQIPETDPDDLEEKYVGWYLLYYPATDDSGDITRGLATISREGDDIFFQFSLAERGNPNKLLFKYKSLLFPLKEKLYIIGEELHAGNEMSLAILNTTTHPETGKPEFLRGLYLGVALGSRQPVSSKAILIYGGSLDEIPTTEKLELASLPLGNFPPHAIWNMKIYGDDITNSGLVSEERLKYLFLMDNGFHFRHILQARMEEEERLFQVYRYVLELLIKLFPQEDADPKRFMDLCEPFSKTLHNAGITHTCDFYAPHLDPSIVSIRVGLASEHQLTPVERDECLQRIYRLFCEFMTEKEHRFWPLFASNAGDVTKVATKFYPYPQPS